MCGSSTGAAGARPASVPTRPRRCRRHRCRACFRGTMFGISVWARLLFELYAANRPLRRVAAWFEAQGLPVSPGTLSDGHGPDGGAVCAAVGGDPCASPAGAGGARRRNQLEGPGVRRDGLVQPRLAVDRDLLWMRCICMSMHRAAPPPPRRLLGGLRKGAVLVCDRYSAYKKLARLAVGRLVLAFCWAHVRRDFIKVAAARGDLEDWKDQWLSPDPAPVQAERAALATSRSRQAVLTGGGI